MCICVYVYMCICVYAYMRICVYAYMRICVYVYMCICAYAYMRMCVCAYVPICVYAYNVYNMYNMYNMCICVYVYMIKPVQGQQHPWSRQYSYSKHTARRILHLLHTGPAARTGSCYLKCPRLQRCPCVDGAIAQQSILSKALFKLSRQLCSQAGHPPSHLRRRFRAISACRPRYS